MKARIRLNPPNSLVVPSAMGGRSVASTSCAICIGTLASIDGETEILLTDEAAERKLDGTPVFSGMIETPGRCVAVCSTMDEVLVECRVEGELTRVSVWTNDANEPDLVEVLVGS